MNITKDKWRIACDDKHHDLLDKLKVKFEFKTSKDCLQSMIRFCHASNAKFKDWKRGDEMTEVEILQKAQVEINKLGDSVKSYIGDWERRYLKPLLTDEISRLKIALEENSNHQEIANIAKYVKSKDIELMENLEQEILELKARYVKALYYFIPDPKDDEQKKKEREEMVNGLTNKFREAKTKLLASGIKNPNFNDLARYYKF